VNDGTLGSGVLGMRELHEADCARGKHRAEAAAAVLMPRNA
jgi:hypothetical protein